MRLRESKCLSSFLVLMMVLWAGIASSQTYSFKHFGIEKNVFPSRIEALAQAKNGELLVGTLAGLVVYDGYEFEQFTVNEGLTENAISSIHVHGERVWLGHWAGSISMVNLYTKDVEHYLIQEQVNFSTIKSLIALNDHELLLCTSSGGVFRLNNGIVEQEVLMNSGRSAKIHSLRKIGNEVFAFGENSLFELVDFDGNKEWKNLIQNSALNLLDGFKNQDGDWVLASQAGLWYGKLNALYLVKSTENLKFNSVCLDAKNEFWAGTEESGVVKIENQKANFIQRTNGLSYNQIRKVFCDREGIVWVATTAGLDQYLGGAFTFHDFSKFTSNSLVWDFDLVGNSIWAGTGDGVIITEFNANGELKPVKSFGQDIVEPRKLIKNGQNGYWIIGQKGGLFSVTGESSVKRFDKINSYVRCMTTVNKDWWIGTDNGIFVMRNDSIIANYNKESGLGGDKVNGVYFNKVTQETWITFLGGNVTVFRNGRFKQFDAELGLTSRVIQDADFDTQNRIWLASYDQGVFYCQSDTFHNINSQNGLASNTTFAIEVDYEDNVWIGHNWGLDQYRTKYKDVQHFGADEGFMGIEVNPGALKLDDKGNVWMGTLMGILCFDRTQFSANMVEPIIRVISAFLGSKNLMNSEGEISVSDNDFRVKFRGVSLVNPAKNTYKYRLSGIHSNWKTIKYDTPIEYFSLPPGYYKFELLACNNDGQCNVNPVTFDFVVKPPFYRTWWFYTILFALAVMLIFFMDRYRAVSLLEEKNKLSDKIEHKEQIIHELKQELVDVKGVSNLTDKLFNSLNIDTEMTLELAKHHFNGIAFKQWNKQNVSSDQMITMKHDKLVLFGLLDTGISGPIAAYLVKLLQEQMNEALRTLSSPNPLVVFNLFDQITQKMSSKIGRHKGFNWVICLDDSKQKYYHQKGMSIFIQDQDNILELTAVERKNGERISDIHLLQLDKSKLLFTATDGLFELMNEDGSRHFTSSQFVKYLKEEKGDDVQQIMGQLSQRINDWGGNLEQHDDISILIWRHE